MKRIGRVLATLCVLVLACSANRSLAALGSSLDRERVALGDTLRLTISATEDEELGDLDLRPLTKDFEILGRSSNNKTSYVNGKFSSKKELLLDITPRRQGNLTIPPLRLGAQVTRALPVNVGPPPKSSAADQNLLFEAELDREQVYVQGQVILTLRLQQAINLEDRGISELRLDGAFVRQLEQNSFQRTLNGRPWLVHEVRYAIFPEQSGTLEVPAQTFSARESTPRRSLFDLGRGGRQVRRSTKPLIIEVLPRPDSYPNAEWLPAAALTLEETWSTPPEQLKVGESATRTITLRGEGLQGAQLAPMMFPPTEGLKYYPDQPNISDSESGNGLVGTRVDSVAVVPTRAGQWQIPELRIPWWDTGSNELRYAVLPARTLEVAAADPAQLTALPAPQPQTAAAPAIPIATNIPLTSDGGSPLWQIFSVVNGAGWLLTLLYLFLSRRRRAEPDPSRTENPDEKKTFKELLAACAGGDARQAREAVINWTAAQRPGCGIASLAQVGAVHLDPAMDRALDSLNSTLYGSETAPWDGAALAECARRLRAQYRDSARREEPPLQLYPQLT